MRKQSGNFLLQALLALTLVFAFMPFFANKLSSRDTEARLYSVSNQIETVHNVARIFLRDEFKNHYPNGTVTFSKSPSNCPTGYNCNFSVLESYGLPMGFNPQTVFKQDISLVATREVRDGGEVVVNGYINLTRGDLTGKNLEWAQLLRMLGLYASGNNVNINDSTAIHIVVPVEEPYSDVVLKHETDANIGFLTELDMGDNNIYGIKDLYANNGFTDYAKVYNLSLTNNGGMDTPRLECVSATFYPPMISGTGDVSAASLTLSNVDVKTAKAIFGSVSNNEKITAQNVYANTLSLAAAGSWTVGDGSECKIDGSLFLPTGYIKIYKKDLNAKNLFGVYYQDGTNPTACNDNGTTVENVLKVDRLVATKSDKVGGVISKVSQNQTPEADVDINFTGGISLVPDILVDGIDNTKIKFLTYLTAPTAVISTCTQPFNEENTSLSDGSLIKNSIAHNVLCQYLFYHRLERRINYKLRLMCGGAHCIF